MEIGSEKGAGLTKGEGRRKIRRKDKRTQNCTRRNVRILYLKVFNIKNIYIYRTG